MEWIWIALVGFVLLFGTKKLPEMAKTIGKAMGELQRGRMEIEKEIQIAAQPIQEVAEDIKEAQHDFRKIQGEVTNTQRNVLAPLNLNKKRSEPVEEKSTTAESSPSMEGTKSAENVEAAESTEGKKGEGSTLDKLSKATNIA